MPLPTVSDVRTFLEGYQITTSILSDAWITNELTNNIIPFVEETIRGSLATEQQVTEWYSGTGKTTLILDRRNINSLVKIELVEGENVIADVSINNVDLLAKQGIIKAKTNINEGFYFTNFSKGNNNIRITYKFGGTINNNIFNAIVKLCVCAVFSFLEGRTGGGSITTEGWSRDFGNMGKYSNVRKQLNAQAMRVLRKYSTGIVGS